MNQTPRLTPSAKDGLSAEQVLSQKQAGLQNAAPEKITKTTGQIIRDNVCTLFNLFNLLIALALAAVHAWSNLFFMAIIALNTAIGIFQEIQAKKLVDKLSPVSYTHLFGYALRRREHLLSDKLIVSSACKTDRLHIPIIRV